MKHIINTYPIAFIILVAVLGAIIIGICINMYLKYDRKKSYKRLHKMVKEDNKASKEAVDLIDYLEDRVKDIGRAKLTPEQQDFIESYYKSMPKQKGE